ncbi:MAG: DinB family protein [Phycisphaerales bacterium]|nr:DinB family protein [Phycisphaerales bacterium]
MPTISDPFDMLLAHDRWATDAVLSLCERLTAEQFGTSFPIGPGEQGGLRATLTHIVGAMRRWADRIGDRPLRPFPTPDQATVASLRADLDAASDELGALIPGVRADPDRIVALTYEGRTYRFTAACAMLHVLTHGHYHRAQCLNMLRRLAVPGVSDALPDLDVIDWQHATQTVR